MSKKKRVIIASLVFIVLILVLLVATSLYVMNCVSLYGSEACLNCFLRSLPVFLYFALSNLLLEPVIDSIKKLRKGD